MPNTSLLYYNNINIINIKVRVILSFKMTFIHLYSKVPSINLLMPHLYYAVYKICAF